MKKFLICSLVLLTTAMVGCASSSSHESGLVRAALEKAVEVKCYNELDDSKIWKTASYLMSLETAQRTQKRICGCVSDQGLKNVETSQLFKASFSEAQKNEVVKKLVVNSLRYCTVEMLKAN